MESGDMSFPRSDHKTDAIARILLYYLLCECDSTAREKEEMPKSNIEKKKKS